MRIVPVVKFEEAELARRMEERLIGLPKESGVLFVGVRVIAEDGKNPTQYCVFVGCSKEFDERLFHSVVQATLAQEIALGAVVTTEVRRGVSRYLPSVWPAQNPFLPESS